MQKRERKGSRQTLEGTTGMPQLQRHYSPPSDVPAIRRRGRPLGSKNRPKVAFGDVQKRERKGSRQPLEGTTGMPQSQRGYSPPSDVPAIRRRGRPLGSKSRPKVAFGPNFTPQVIIINQGEDVLEKLSTFFPKGSRSASILSANGSLYSVTIRFPGSANILYKGCFSLISLSGSFGATGSTDVSSRMSISFGGVNGRVYGGEVVGPLMAASCIQIVVATHTSEPPKKQGKAFVDRSSAIMLCNTPNEGT